ncbi:hypothetical protein LWI28_022515 [Acer negundo]|uniref:ABC transporter domain-containing protein n=1 Tax=Acer negundo TaxID=4023 RepID=A0AAD5IX52_ACENE|nr:hypothetical protein LWI28_022515 [Acer negundo]
MELQGGFPLLLQQFIALFKKNFLLARKNKVSTFIQLFSSLFFIFLIFCIEKANNSTYRLESVKDPKPLVSPPIPPCEEKHFVKLPCYDFLWSGNDSSRAKKIVSAIMKNNPNRPIPENKVLSFETPGDVDEWLDSNILKSPGALHFMDRNASVISYGIQTNSTPSERRGLYEDPTFKFQIPLQIAAEREIARFLLGDPKLGWEVGLKGFAHPEGKVVSAISSVGPTFFLAIAMFGFVFQISALVTEKELRLRQAMTMMGLFDSAYWLSWLMWETIITLLSSFFIVLFGMMFQFDFFLKNDFIVVFLLFFLFQLNMIVTKFGFPYNKDYTKLKRQIWSLFPPNLLAKALSLLTDAPSIPGSDAGLRWSKRAECLPTEPECLMTINDIYLWLLGTFVAWFVLAIYLDNLVPNAAGVRQATYYFLMPGYWTGSGGSNVQEGSIFSCSGKIPRPEYIAPDDEDVLEEENTVKQQAKDGLIDPNVAVQLRGLVKTYPGARKTGSCCGKMSSPFHAVRGSWMNIAKNQCFCLLGPNGAGKSTTIGCLTGISPLTRGDALIYGNSIHSSVGMSNVRKIIGVCPQFDVLWEALSGHEHLELFASIKGLPLPAVKSVAEKSSAEVGLTWEADMRAGSYSGGMKRRLSIAIAFIGDPKLVILDEPTTGMDPITRRYVWDVIEVAKKGRAIILTTHSMEEADILGDRIAIMAKGRVRCIGTSIRLKSKFGAGFIANVSFTASNYNPEAVKHFFKHNLAVVPKEETKSHIRYVIPHDREGFLTNFFAELQDRQGEFGIADIQLSLTTLEEVFLNIVKKAELETAVSEGRMVTLTLDSGESLEIPLAAKYVGIPGTESAENPEGMMVEVQWAQDDSGSLCIAGHSPQMPVPDKARAAPSHASNKNVLGDPRTVYGIVYQFETDKLS